MTNKILNVLKRILSPLDFMAWGRKHPSIPVKCYTFLLMADDEGMVKQVTVIAADQLKAEQRLEAKYPHYVKNFLGVNSKSAILDIKQRGKNRFLIFFKTIFVHEPAPVIRHSEILY